MKNSPRFSPCWSKTSPLMAFDAQDEVTRAIEERHANFTDRGRSGSSRKSATKKRKAARFFRIRCASPDSRSRVVWPGYPRRSSRAGVRTNRSSGSASTTAAIAVKEWHGSSGTSGTIRLHRMISCAGKGSPIRATPWHPTGASFCCNLRRRGGDASPDSIQFTSLWIGSKSSRSAFLFRKMRRLKQEV